MSQFQNKSQDDFDKRRERFGYEFAETKRQIERSQRRAETFLCVWVGVAIGVIGFGCWCVYHILKAKGWVP